LERKQYQRRYAQAVRQLERMRLVAPIAGRVEKVVAQPGEAVKTLGPVIKLVKTDPLWIDVPVPLSQMKQVALGQKVTVVFPGAERVEVPDGKITHIAAVADAASDTLNVRIEVVNLGSRPAGERVSVKFLTDQNDKKVARLDQR
jgi:multidrug resistance efflux pump